MPQRYWNRRSILIFGAMGYFLVSGNRWRFKLVLDVFRSMDKTFFKVSLGKNLDRNGLCYMLGMIFSLIGILWAYDRTGDAYTSDLIVPALIGSVIGGLILLLPIRWIVRPYVIAKARKQDIEESERKLTEEVKEVLRHSKVLWRVKPFLSMIMVLCAMRRRGMFHQALAYVVIAACFFAFSTSVSAAEALGYFSCPVTTKGGHKIDVMTKPHRYAYEPPAGPKNSSPEAFVEFHFKEEDAFAKAVDQKLDRFLARIPEVYGVPCPYKKGDGFVFVHGPFHSQDALQQDLKMGSMVSDIMAEHTGQGRRVEYISIE